MLRLGADRGYTADSGITNGRCVIWQGSPGETSSFAIAFFWYRHKPISKEELFLNAGRKIQR
jgi:hypothetical protein